MGRQSRVTPSGHTILVVDDQAEVLVSLGKLLEREGHSVLAASSGRRALELFKEHDVNLILVDYFMPRMTGEELIREIRKFDPYVQIILQTGYAGEKPARLMMAELDIQGYHDKSDGPEKLLLWVEAGLKAYRLLSQVRERERVQNELVANVSHEFRTPLNVIAGYTGMLNEGAFGTLPPAANKPLAAIEQATQSLTELVADFLNYAKVEAGVIDVVQEPVETALLARDLQRLGTLLVEGKDISFGTDLDQAPVRFPADPVKLRAILRNLVANAAKFTAAGAISLSIAQDRERLWFTVRDTGPGIPNDQLDTIFEPFRQLDGSTTRQHGGVGLGLALSRKLARILGGDLKVESTLGVGSVFSLVLPVEATTRENAAKDAWGSSRNGAAGPLCAAVVTG